jgi:alpha-methylacyl-CoA racemase
MGGSLTAVMGILAALFDVTLSGRGRYLDVAISDSPHAVLPLARVHSKGAVGWYGQYLKRSAQLCAI